MKLMDAEGLSADNLRKNPVRTLLTILGLGVGIGAVLTVLTLGSAGEEQVEHEIARLGVDKVWITAKAGGGAGLDLLSGEKAAAATGSPACAGAYTLSAVSLGEKTVAAQVAGFDGGMEAVHGPVLRRGRLFTAREYRGEPVALATAALEEALGGDVLGRRVDAGSRRVRVVGVMEDMQGTAAGTSNGMLVLPLATFLDTYAACAVSEVTVGVPRGGRAERVGDAAVAALGGENGSLRVSSLQEEIDAARSVIRIFVMVLACVAAVCMLTGGIGVMNILLVSVRERRREIGLMKAIGATARQVGMLFLMEAVCYALLGGLLGIMTGMGMIRVFGAWIGLNASLRVETAVPAVLAAGVLGMVFGVAPALRAAGMQPVEALREE